MSGVRSLALAGMLFFSCMQHKHVSVEDGWLLSMPLSPLLLACCSHVCFFVLLPTYLLSTCFPAGCGWMRWFCGGSLVDALFVNFLFFSFFVAAYDTVDVSFFVFFCCCCHGVVLLSGGGRHCFWTFFFLIAWRRWS